VIEFSETKAVDHGTSPREAKRGDQKSPRLVASTQRRDSAVVAGGRPTASKVAVTSLLSPSSVRRCWATGSNYGASAGASHSCSCT
jgi:hypothetical protein